jgi:hypothetical protein
MKSLTALWLGWKGTDEGLCCQGHVQTSKEIAHASKGSNFYAVVDHGDGYLPEQSAHSHISCRVKGFVAGCVGQQAYWGA